MKPLTAALCGMLLLSALPALAQNLSRAQAGREAVGQCYTACMTDQRNDQAIIAWTALFWDNWQHSSEMSAEAWDSFLSWWQRTGCSIDQDTLTIAYVCAQGCRDVERAFGVGAAYGKSEFHHEFNQFAANLKPSGLWRTNNRNRPRSGTQAFNNACQRYWNPDAAASIHTIAGRDLPDLMKRESAERPAR